MNSANNKKGIAAVVPIVLIVGVILIVGIYLYQMNKSPDMKSSLEPKSVQESGNYSSQEIVVGSPSDLESVEDMVLGINIDATLDTSEIDEALSG